MVSLIRSALPLSSADIIDGIVRNATTDPALRQLLNGIVCAPLDITNGRKPKTDAPPVRKLRTPCGKSMRRIRVSALVRRLRMGPPRAISCTRRGVVAAAPCLPAPHPPPPSQRGADPV